MTVHQKERLNKLEYFLLQQDRRYCNTPILKNVFNSIDKKDICIEKSSRIDDITSVFVESNKRMQYIDILDMQLFIVSEEMKALLEMYEPQMIFKTISMIDFNNQVNTLYYLPIIEEVDCISGKSVFNLDKSVLKKIVIKEENIADKSIFRLKGVDTPYIIIRLDLAESIMRRKFKGVKLTRLEKE